MCYNKNCINPVKKKKSGSGYIKYFYDKIEHPVMQTAWLLLVHSLKLKILHLCNLFKLNEWMNVAYVSCQEE